MTKLLDEKSQRMIEAMDAENATDPKVVTWGSEEFPRELLFARRVAHWLEKLNPDCPSELLIAAHGHTLRRWDVPRSFYPMDNAGYHQWRDACAAHHAKVARKILEEHGCSDEVLREVLALILKSNWPTDPRSRLLEDADCLAFLELKLADYVDTWEKDKAIRILRKTVAKMTPAARVLARSIPLNPDCSELLNLAVARTD